MARVYSFVMGGKTRQKNQPDYQLWLKHLENQKSNRQQS
jgi:hypothetical protein